MQASDMVEIGELDTLVTLQECTITRNERGAKVYSWEDFRDVYAKVDRSVDETVTNENLESGHLMSLTIYKVPELTTRWRVILEDVPYSIESISNPERFSPLYTLTIRAIDGSAS